MPRDREVAGIRCMQVLADLPEYLEKNLPEARTTQIEDHLRGCDWCERFGGEYASAIAALRRHLASPPAPSASIRSRLRARVEREILTPDERPD